MEAHPLFGRKMIRAKKNGAFVVVADPRYTPTAKLADVYLQFKTGTDVALMNGMMKIIIENDLQDDEFIANRTKGYEELKETVMKYDLDRVAEITEADPELIERAALEYAKAENAAIVYGATLDGKFLTQILEINASNAVIRNIRFVNSSGISVNIGGKNVTLDNCSFENSINGELGSALSCFGDDVKVLNSRFLNNIANKSSCHHTL